MQVHLVDGTYELFRAFYAKAPGHLDDGGVEVGAVRGVVTSLLALLDDGATHVGVATDHVIESWRNERWPGYKTGEGIDPALYAQFPLLEDALRSLGVTVWAMVDQEADDALAAAAAVAAADSRCERVVICTPDKDLAQCVGGKVVQWDRRQDRWYDTEGVVEKFGVAPASIPDFLALVGDSADGFPGLPGWGAKSAAAVLRRWGHVEAVPADPASWAVEVRGAARLAESLREGRELAMLFKDLATLRTDIDVGEPTHWRWSGPDAGFTAWARRLGRPALAEQAAVLAARREGTP